MEHAIDYAWFCPRCLAANQKERWYDLADALPPRLGRPRLDRLKRGREPCIESPVCSLATLPLHDRRRQQGVQVSPIFGLAQITDHVRIVGGGGEHRVGGEEDDRQRRAL